MCLVRGVSRNGGNFLLPVSTSLISLAAWIVVGFVKKQKFLHPFCVP
jgi:hypothetical protein